MNSGKCLALLVLAAAPIAAQADEAAGPYGALTGGGNYARDQDLGAASGALGFESGGLGVVGLGYAFGSGFRPELEYGYRSNDVRQEQGADGEERVNSAMANLWYDFGSLIAGSKLRPYVGGGAGAANVRFQEVVDEAGVSRSADDTVFAYQAGAGLNYLASQRLTLSLGYRYLETDKARFEGAPGSPGDVFTPATPATPAIEPRYRSDGVLAGLSYSFGGGRSAMPVASNEPPAADTGPVAAGPPFEGDLAAMETVTLRPVNFQFDKAELTEPSKGTLDELAAKLAGHSEMTVTIQGYTDSVGSPGYNKQLGKKRAQAVRDYLVSKGVAEQSLQVASGGQANPVADNSTEEGRAQNRRAEVKPQGSSNVNIVIEAPTEESVEAAKQK